MNHSRYTIDGPVGAIEVAVSDPGGHPHGLALVAHPHPLFGGTLDNKVVTTLAKTFSEMGWFTVRPNFRGVGKTEGAHDHGVGETDDLVQVLEHFERELGHLPLLLSGFSFGGGVQTFVAKRVRADRLALVAPAVTRLQVENVPPSTLVIHGEADDVVPLTAVMDWARPQELPIVVVPGADHFFHRRLHQIEAILQQWLS
jgi:hypothetical protein